MRLPNDMARCSGQYAYGPKDIVFCPIKHTCLRYLAGKEQNDMNAVVPFMAAPTTSGNCRMYIPVKED